MPKIAIVAGEASGDMLGFHLIKALQKSRKDLSFFGIAGPKMMSLGVETRFPMERLSVRGYVEVLKHLYGLIQLRKQLLQQILAEKPDIFIGIDAPDFNFWLEKKLKAHGIPTIHYVSPSIWAWRKSRIRKIKKAVSHILALFPFEPAIYEKAQIPVTYIGHPLADALPIRPKVAQARETLQVKDAALVVAMLPGSRQSEVAQHAELFVATAAAMMQQQPQRQVHEWLFLVPLITRETRDIFQKAFHRYQEQHPQTKVNIQVMFGHAHDAMTAADIVIVASGTATLEAALLKKPMVITYRMPSMSWHILKHMRYLPYVGLPNVLADRFVVPELLQHQATPDNIAQTANDLLADKAQCKEIKQTFTNIHHTLRQDSAKKAAETVLTYLS